MSLSVTVDRDQRADDITSSCRHPNPSAGAILSWVRRSHSLFFPPIFFLRAPGLLGMHSELPVSLPGVTQGL